MKSSLARRVAGLLEPGRCEPLVIVKLRALERIFDREWSRRDVLELVNLTIELDEIGAAQASSAILSYTPALDGQAAHHRGSRGARGLLVESGQSLLS
jgi:hypothetical protein